MTHDEAVDRICEMHEHVVRLTAERDELLEALEAARRRLASHFDVMLSNPMHQGRLPDKDAALLDQIKAALAKGETDGK